MSLRPRRDGRQGILPFVMVQAKRDDVTARAGLPLVVETMRALGVDELAARELPQQKRKRGFAPAQKLEAIVTLIAAGGDRVVGGDVNPPESVEDLPVLTVSSDLLGVQPVPWLSVRRARWLP